MQDRDHETVVIEKEGGESVKLKDDRKKERFWLTPPNLYKRLDDEFHFDTDPCPHPRPAGYDGLKAPWGRSNYVNPPFGGNAISWGRRCIEEGKEGKIVVYIKPVWDEIHELLVTCTEVRSLGRIRWLSIETGKPSPLRCYNIVAFIYHKRRGDKGGKILTSI